MKFGLTAVTILVSVAFATAAAALAATTAPTGSDTSSSGPPCIGKVTTIKGYKAAVNCGPATATLHIGGKTYAFRHGYCGSSKSANAALQLDLGTAVPTAKGNAGQPHFNITVAKNLPSASVSAAYGGKTLIDDALVSVSGKVPAGGTFKSKFSGPGFGPSFSGSWNCHGVVWRTP